MGRRSRGASLGAGLVVLLLAAGGVWLVTAGPLGAGPLGAGMLGDETPPVSTDAAAGAVDAASALSALEGLDAAPGWSARDYDRDLFGPRWADVDRNGCDTRNDILGRDLLEPTFRPGTGDCTVLTGTLIDPYDGTATSFVRGPESSPAVQIDHVVALSWAWHHGADEWSDARREEFANDPENLVAASEATNQAKSAFGPGEWMPPAAPLRCAYVARFVSVLDAYDLAIGVADRDAARAVLERC